MYSEDIMKYLLEVRPDVKLGNLPGELGFEGPLGLKGQPTQQCHLGGKHRVVSMAYYRAMAHSGGYM